MEEWRFLDSDSNIFQNPTAALNLTTERWLLQPFPDGLVASTGTWDASNETTRVSFQHQLDLGVTYQCWGFVCSDTRSCRSVDDPCFVPVEGIGTTTVGPAHSNIVALTHGIVSLLVSIITLAVVMGCLCWKSDASDITEPARHSSRDTNNRRHSARHSALEQDRKIARQYARPVREPAQCAVEVDWVCAAPASEAEKTKHIARLTALLREMYALDIQAWSMEGVAQREADKENLLRVRAEAERVFGEVAFVAGQWQAVAAKRRRGAWTAEEAKVIDAICTMITEYLPRGYL